MLTSTSTICGNKHSQLEDQHIVYLMDKRKTLRETTVQEVLNLTLFTSSSNKKIRIRFRLV